MTDSLVLLWQLYLRFTFCPLIEIFYNKRYCISVRNIHRCQYSYTRSCWLIVDSKHIPCICKQGIWSLSVIFSIIFFICSTWVGIRNISKVFSVKNNQSVYRKITRFPFICRTMSTLAYRIEIEGLQSICVIISLGSNYYSNPIFWNENILQYIECNSKLECHAIEKSNNERRHFKYCHMTCDVGVTCDYAYYL